MEQLPPLPDHIGPLRPDAAFDALLEREPGMWRSPEQDCKTCGGEKIFKRYNPATGEVTEFECDCFAQWLLHVHLLNAGIKTGYQRSSWDDVDQQVPDEVIDKIGTYASDAKRYVRAGRGMILRGTNGTGKTLLAVLLLKQLISLGYGGYFVSFHDLLDSYADTWKTEGDNRYRQYVSSDFLVIDEVHGRGIGGQKHISESMFDHLIRSRVSDDRPTIITTNLTMEQIETGFGHSVISLLAENSEVVEVSGTDFRPKARKREDTEFGLDTVRPLVLV